jgi:hypothetical protein
MLLALLIRVILPPGVMVARVDGASQIVICTGHGAATVDVDRQGHPIKAPKPAANGICAFAVCASSALPAGPQSPACDAARLASRLPTVMRRDLVPGRGLAAPPPQAQAPPTNLA